MKKIIKELRLENNTKEDIIDDLINSAIIFGGAFLLIIVLL